MHLFEKDLNKAINLEEQLVSMKFMRKNSAKEYSKGCKNQVSK